MIVSSKDVSPLGGSSVLEVIFLRPQFLEDRDHWNLIFSKLRQKTNYLAKCICRTL